MFAPAIPEVRRSDDGSIEIHHDYFRRTTIRLDDDESRQALFECLEKGIEATFGEGIEGWSRDRIQRETGRIQDECLKSHGVSVPLPSPPGGDAGGAEHP